jgi:glycerol-3-phosphate acyltransferase PlsY
LPERIIAVCIVLLVVGVRWPVWLRFKGGRGNTAGMAALLAASFPGFLAALGF